MANKHDGPMCSERCSDLFSFVLFQRRDDGGPARTRVRALVQEEAGNTPARAKEEASQQGRGSALKLAPNASTPVSKDPSHAQICSPTFTNISAIKRKEEVRDVRRMLATPEGGTAK